jgi:VIT1/CCC1 family predicted Fe2+/Mn2+ transporter
MTLLKKEQERMGKNEENHLPTNSEELIVRLKATEGYLSTFLKENMSKEIAITSELEEIKNMSESVQEQIKSTSQKSINSLQTVNEDYKKHITNNLLTLAKMVEKLEKELNMNRATIDKELKEIKSEMQTEIKSLSQSARNRLNEIDQTTNRMVLNARKQIFLNYWLDVAKYGLGTAVFIVPLYIGIKYLFSLFGIELL